MIPRTWRDRLRLRLFRRKPDPVPTDIHLLVRDMLDGVPSYVPGSPILTERKRPK